MLFHTGRIDLHPQTFSLMPCISLRVLCPLQACVSLRWSIAEGTKWYPFKRGQTCLYHTTPFVFGTNPACTSRLGRTSEESTINLKKRRKSLKWESDPPPHSVNYCDKVLVLITLIIIYLVKILLWSTSKGSLKFSRNKNLPINWFWKWTWLKF